MRLPLWRHHCDAYVYRTQVESTRLAAEMNGLLLHRDLYGPSPQAVGKLEPRTCMPRTPTPCNLAPATLLPTRGCHFNTNKSIDTVGQLFDDIA